MRLTHLKKGSAFVLLNFAAPFAFFVLYEAAGAKPAIALAVVVTLIQAAIHWIRSIPISPFYVVASGFTVGFGLIDLVIASPRFFRLEPFAQNFLIGSVFLISLATRRSVLAWLINGLPPAFRPHLGDDSDNNGEMAAYLKKLTLIWGIYLIVKAMFFLYLAFHVNLGHLVILRTIIGGGSLFVLLGGEIIYRRWRFGPHHPHVPQH